MKKIFFGIAAAALAMSVSACGNKGENSAQQTPVETETTDFKIDTIAALDNLTPEEGVERSKALLATPSGLKYRVIKEGTGNSPDATQTVEVNYEGRLLNGHIFDSSYDRGQSISFPLNGVIPGWTEGVQLMKEGGIYEFYIPYNLAYGERGAGQDIPPYADLVFKIQLIKVQDKAETPQQPQQPQ